MATASLPVEILLGVYLGLLTGVIPAVIAGAMGFVFRYLTGVTVPGFGVLVLALTVAGVNGGLLGLLDPTILASPRLLVATLVIMMLALYAHSEGDKLGARLPRRFSLRELRRRTLSAEVVDVVGGRGQVTIRAGGPVEDMEGYPPLSADLRTSIRDGSWQFPADLPLSELETRLAERLRNEYDLADVSVSLDTQARASITAAPPASGLSRRIPSGKRAVSVNALLPTGIARGEEVAVLTPDGTRIEGTAVSARSDPGAESPAPATPASADTVETDGGTDDTPPVVPTPTTSGGEGRVTVAVSRPEAETLLGIDRARVVVLSRGTRREFELVSVLRRAGRRFRKLSVRAGSSLDGVTLGEASVRETYGVAVLAVRHPPSESADAETGGRRERRRARKRDRERQRSDAADRPRIGWEFSPRGSTRLSPNDELFAVGTRDALARFEEAVA